MISTIQKGKKQKFFLELIKDFVQDEQINLYDFNQLDAFLAMVGSEFRRGALDREDLLAINSAFSREFLQGTLQGRSLTKPCGYSGDYLLLDYIYTNRTSTNPEHKIWDTYFQKQTAARAIRNRKEYFKEQLYRKASQMPNLRLLNVVSGSGRELLELYNTLPVNYPLRTTCIEIDDSAIEYSKNLNKNYLGKINYVHDNIFRYDNDSERDIIWCAGLLNTLEDRASLLLIKRFKDWLKPGGEIIIGNFNKDYNPSRDFMEIFGEWFLNHRTEKQLLKMGLEAGFTDEQIEVSKTEDGVILYLHLRLDQ
ncbi:MAG: methyltransferase domain-containing protein [Flavobacteriaceae bacterium]